MQRRGGLLMLILNSKKNSAITLFRAAIQDGEPVIFPTDTIYGIGAPILSPAANRKIYDIKNRDTSMPMPVLIGSWEQFYQLAQPISTNNETWLRQIWADAKNPHTVVVRAADNIPSMFCKDGTIALRMINVPYLAEALARVGAVTATSVNLSGEPPINNPEDIAKKFGGICKYMLWGKPAGNTASVIVDISGEERKILR